ncbi:LysR family transcriptional regulator [Actinokineospora pegani]|uniref:LysR family transcriptional regulator n=1 Tax=Actinokineospora pegani TaxID=2654637 RepID=UPI0012EAD2BD|nr:LysR family transcriptional regulator [Actinokineospora pegani]
MGELDLAAVRAFAVVAATRHFGDAAVDLGITQQAVSKRVARLEADLGVALFARQRSGADLTPDGAAFLPHATRLLATADAAVAAARGGRAALRVDVLDTRLAGTDLLRGFHRHAGDVDLELVTSTGLRESRGAVLACRVDAAFARVTGPLDGLRSAPACLDPLELLVAADHPLAGRASVALAELAGMTAWMPGNEPGSEWAAYYAALGPEFGIEIDVSGPNFGYEDFVRRLGESSSVIGFGGELVALPRREDVVAIPVSAPRPCYLWSLVWREDTANPAVRRLVDYVSAQYTRPRSDEVWLPAEDWSMV